MKKSETKNSARCPNCIHPKSHHSRTRLDTMDCYRCYCSTLADEPRSPIPACMECYAPLDKCDWCEWCVAARPEE